MMLSSAVKTRTLSMVLWRCPVLSSAGQVTPNLLMCFTLSLVKQSSSIIHPCPQILKSIIKFTFPHFQVTLRESSTPLSHLTMSLYGLTLTNTLFQLNHCSFPIKMLVIDFSVGFFGILVDLVIAASPAWYHSQKSQSDFPGTCHVRRIGISSPCMSSSSWAVKGF